MTSINWVVGFNWVEQNPTTPKSMPLHLCWADLNSDY